MLHPVAFDRKAHELALMFKRNFEQSGFEAPHDVKAGGPAGSDSFASDLAGLLQAEG